MEQIEWIDRYLDRSLSADEALGLEQTLQIDADLRNLLDRVSIARDAVRSSALRGRVRDLHFQLIDEIRQQEDATEWNSDVAVVRPLWYGRPLRWSARVAATGLLLMLGYGGYQFASIDTTTYYNNKFLMYQLPNARGTDERVTPLDSLYRAGNYEAVTQQFAAMSTQTVRDQFLSGMAFLQQEQYSLAIECFKAVQQTNKQSEKALFNQETDYYLALAYLGAERIDDAYPLFETIRNTPRHLYHQNVTEQDLWKLSLLRWKK